MNPLSRLLWEMLMRHSGRVVNGINKQSHMIQSARLAEAAGKDERYIVMCLFHDIFGGVCPDYHGEIAALMLRPYIGETYADILKYHAAYQLDNWKGEAHDQNAAPEMIEFVDKFDFPAFDKAFVVSPRDQAHFESMTRRVVC